MVVVNPNDTAHEVNIVPRTEVNNTVLIRVVLFNESTGESETQIGTLNPINDTRVLNFTKAFNENDRYSFSVENATSPNDIIYRGLLIATTQTPQDYKVDNDNWQYSTQ